MEQKPMIREPFRSCFSLHKRGNEREQMGYHKKMKIAGIIITLILAFAPLPATAQTGVVEAILDGDTYDIRVEGKIIRVRLYGVDAPELHLPEGKEARHFVSALIFKKRVNLIIRGVGVYHRTLAIVRFASGKSLAMELLKTGRATVYVNQFRPKPRRLFQQYINAQRRAMKKSIGIFNYKKFKIKK